MVPLRKGEAESIGGLKDWRSFLGVDALFSKNKLSRQTGKALAKRDDGACVFLGSDNLCEIHRHFGLKAKPLACRLYPFVLTPVAGKMRVGLRFDCPAVCENEGQKLASYHKELKDFLPELVPTGPNVSNDMSPDVMPAVRLESWRFEVLNESLLKMAGSNAMSLLQRLHWIRKFVDHVEKVKWAKADDKEFGELVKLFEGGLLAEVQQTEPVRRPPKARTRKLLGQVFFLLSQPAVRPTIANASFMKKLGGRIGDARQLKGLTKVSGPLPGIRSEWPDCDMSQLEASFGDWPVDVEEMVTRYLVCRIGGVGYCGPNFYDFSMVEGMRSLLLGLVSLGWVMRIAALAAGREGLELADAHRAVMILDGNLGYSPALGVGPSRLRLKYLSEHLEDLLNWYCQ
jgi:lysine-N-methylase